MKTKSFQQRALLTISIVLLLSGQSWASSISVSGTISSNTTWTGVDSVLVTGDITVNDGVTLTIGPGMIVSFQGSYIMNVNGRLLAIGTVADTIKFTVADTTGFLNNTYTGWKGIRFYNTPATNDTSRISYCLLEYAKLPNDQYYSAICAYHMHKLLISNCEIRYCKCNYVTFSNAAILCEVSNIKILQNYIHHNKSSLYGSVLAEFSNVLVEENLFTDNITTGAQLGYIYNGTLSLRYCDHARIIGNSLSGNSSQYSGGGILLHENDTVDIINNKILNNVCGKYGGGIFIYNGGFLRIIGNLIAGNQSTGTTVGSTFFGGGGISAQLEGLDSLVIINNTITGNSAYRGGAICMGRDSVDNCVMYNNIIYNNSAVNSGDEIYLSGAKTHPDPLIAFTFLEGGVEGIAVENPPAYSGWHCNVFDVDPRFSGTGADPYSLSPRSYCIDAGLPDTAGLNLPTTDVADNARIFPGCNNRVDIGAYEMEMHGMNYLVADTLRYDVVVNCADTIMVHSDFVIPDGIMLNINTGCKIVFPGYYHFTVNGCFKATGSETDSIFFTPADTAGFHNKTHMGWPGLVFDGTPETNDLSVLKYCDFRYGKAAEVSVRESGGALFARNTSRLRVENCSFENNMAMTSGGAAYAENAEIQLMNSIFRDNYSDLGGAIACVSDNSKIYSNLIDGNVADSAGGAVFFNGNGIVKNNTIVNNRSGQGGAMAFYNNSDAQVTGNILWGNTAATGVSVYLADNTCDPFVNHNDIEGDSAGFAGAGSGPNFAGEYYCNLAMDPLFTGTGDFPYRIQAVSPCADLAQYDTAGMSIPSNDLSGSNRFVNERLDAGAFEYQGSGQYLRMGGHVNGDYVVQGYDDTARVISDIIIDNGKTLTISPGMIVEFDGCYKLSVKGRLLAQGIPGDSILFTVQDTAGFSNNTHTGWNAIEFSVTPATNDSSFIEYSILEYGKGQYGGAIHINFYHKTVIRHCKFRKNINNHMGGAIYYYHSVCNITDNIFEYNKASKGGALYLTDGIISPPIARNIFRFNSASASGGAIFGWVYGLPDLIGNLFDGNECGKSGGAIFYNTPNSQLRIVNNLVINNFSSALSHPGGGGIYINDAPQPIIIINNTICNNSTLGTGGGLHLDWYLTAICSNNIVCGNTAVNGGDQMALNPVYGPGYITWLRNSDIEGGRDSIGGNISSNQLTYEYSLDADPEFSGTGEHPWSLVSTSPCVNTGTPDITGLGIPPTDYAGNPRIYEGSDPRIDMGAYEFQGEKEFHYKALDFDGIDDYVAMGKKVILPGDYTIEIWFNTPANNTSMDLLSGTVSNNHGILLEKRVDNKIRFLHRNPPGTTGGTDVYSSGTYTDGKWHHLAAVKSGADISLYIDGFLAGSATGATGFTDSLTILLGKLKPGTSERFYDGKLDEIRVWNYARDSAEIRIDVHRMISGVEDSLICYWQASSTSDTILDDIRGSNDGILHNMTDDDWITSTAPMPFYSIANGNWNNAATWDTGQGVPVNDWSRILIGSEVILDQDETVINLTIGPGHKLTITSSAQLTAGGN